MRDSHPGTLPDYAHYSCRARIDDAAFNVGEVDYYHEDALTVQLLEEHSDGSITVQVSNGVTAVVAAHKVQAAKTLLHKEEHQHAALELQVTPGSKTPQRKHDNQSSKTKAAVTNATAASSVLTNTQGNYQFDNVANGDWKLTFDACGYALSNKTTNVSSNTTVDAVLSEDASRSIEAIVSSPLSGSTVGVNQAVQLSASASSTFGQTSYLWKSDLDGTLAWADQALVNLSVGTHNLTLTMSNELCTETATAQVVVVEGPVNQLPTASFGWTASGLSTTFTDSSTDNDGTVSTWVWDFGDGATSSEQNPAYQYAVAGDYQITLTVTDNSGGQHSATQTVTVTAAPSDPSELQNGTAKDPIVVGSKDEVFYHINVPAGISSMTINLSGDGDGDLYVKHTSEPTRNYKGADYKSTKWRSAETITINNPSQGTWHIMVYGYKAMTTGQLLVSY
ncbi:MAG: PKD domain-containing protein [Algicola sp.]|nr:PKD domain-containing protein [Algicola sp.]